MNERLLILDRDGVINRESKNFVRSVDEWLPIPGSIEAIAHLSRAGYRIFVATNQSGLTRGLFSAADLEVMHTRLLDLVQEAGGHIAAIYVCPEMPAEPEDRKQRLFRRIAREQRVSLTGVPAVGDSLRDIEAARAVGAHPILVRTGNGLATEVLLGGTEDVDVYDDLAAAAGALLSRR